MPQSAQNFVDSYHFGKRQSDTNAKFDKVVGRTFATATPEIPPPYSYRRDKVSYLQREKEISDLINALKIEHEHEDWDGYGANPINHASLEHAEIFLRSLHITVPLPLYGCEPSGRVGGEWIDGMRLSVGFNPDGSITFAGINKEGRVFNGRGKQELDSRIADFMCLENARTFA